MAASSTGEGKRHDLGWTVQGLTGGPQGPEGQVSMMKVGIADIGSLTTGCACLGRLGSVDDL